MMRKRASGSCLIALASFFLLAVCTKEQASRSSPAQPSAPRPSILLVTLDTTRADSVGPDAVGVETPAFNTVAQRGLRFRQAYATVPQTLPSHSSMMTGLYPAAHGVHENARYLGSNHPLIAERLRDAGYRTAAFVSAFPLARRFGLARGFEVYDDESSHGRAERSAQATTERVLAYLGQDSREPLFLWVHYFDPHEPYEPPEPFRSRYPGNPYRGEIAAMDQQLGHLLQAFEERMDSPTAVIIAGDHGEALGEHGEAEHGKLLYQGVMRVPLVIAGPGVAAAVVDTPVSTRRIFHTILDWAGQSSDSSLRGQMQEVVLGEAMEPFFQYGWQPQVMAVEERQKVIHAGKIEIYDVISDPSESRDLAETATLSRPMRQALRDYPIPSINAPKPSVNLGDEERRKLASLGYVSSDTKPVVRKDAPRPRDMVHLFKLLDRSSVLFAGEKFQQAVPLLEEILARDPHNLAVAIRLAASHSRLGNDERALAAFRKAETIAPDSPDVRHYLALHYAKGKDWERAVPLLERVLQESPDRLPALEALAVIRERQGRFEEALTLRRKIYTMRDAAPAELSQLGELAMSLGQTALAIDSFEKARGLQGARFKRDLELGVLYLSAGRLEEARDALDRVPSGHPGYAMALFKRAQVSVLLGEPDKDARIARARQRADSTTRELIARERLFQASPR